MSSRIHRIAVIADTHGRLPGQVAESLRDADEIWHLGDFCDLRTLAVCQALEVPFLAVLGNNDCGLDLPETLELERGGKVFQLVHIPPRRMPPGGVLLHGHTHVPRDEMVGGCRVLNPGTVGKPNKGAPASWAWLEIGARGAVRWTVNLV